MLFGVTEITVPTLAASRVLRKIMRQVSEIVAVIFFFGRVESRGEGRVVKKNFSTSLTFWSLPQPASPELIKIMNRDNSHNEGS